MPPTQVASAGTREHLNALSLPPILCSPSRFSVLQVATPFLSDLPAPSTRQPNRAALESPLDLLANPTMAFLLMRELN